MSRFSTFVGLDVHKNSIQVALALGGETESARSVKRLPNDFPRLRRLLLQLGTPESLRVCYEAGPTGYGLARKLRAEGFDCRVVAPAKMPRRSGDRVKTDKRDAIRLAEYLRSGLLTFVRVPTPEEEALRDLVRAREDVKKVEMNLKRQLHGLLLRHERIWNGKSTWTKAHVEWVSSQSFEHQATTEAHSLYLQQLLKSRELVAELDVRITEAALGLSRADLVRALQAMKGIKVIVAATIVAEVGDLRRFPSAAHFMSFLGLTPSEFSSGETWKRGRITMAGNQRLRRMLVEAAWAYYRHPHVSRELERRSADVAQGVRDIAWEAQKRLHRRLKYLTASGKNHRKALIAVARELAGFIWAIGQQDELLVRAA